MSRLPRAAASRADKDRVGGWYYRWRMSFPGRFLTRLGVLGALGVWGLMTVSPVQADDASSGPAQDSASSELAALHEAPWDQRGDFILSPKASLEALSELPADAPPRSPGAKEAPAPAGSARHGRTSTATAATPATRSWPGTLPMLTTRAPTEFSPVSRGVARARGCVRMPLSGRERSRTRTPAEGSPSAAARTPRPPFRSITWYR